MNLYIITGASKGLGLGMATELHNNSENTVIDISRSSSEYSCDLSNTQSIAEVIKSIFTNHPPEKYSQISLINNAGVVGPVSFVGELNNEKIQHNLMVNLAAPMVLCNEFVKWTKNSSAIKKIINISSGVATQPMATWGPYSAAKAGIENFSACLSMELQERYEVYCCDPGVVDTGMQKNIRDCSPSEFPNVKQFQQIKEAGFLQTPQAAAKAILIQAKIL